MTDTNARVSNEHGSSNDEYSDDNWAHLALLLMDEADALVRFASVCMPDGAKYSKAANAFWDVCKLLAEERERLHTPLRSEENGND
jgi:hypothetical protein